MSYKENAKKMHLDLVSSKKSSTFASAFAQKFEGSQMAQVMIFERMSIHNKM